MRLLANRILVEPSEVKDVTDSGIIIPDIGKKKASSGKVLGIGGTVKSVAVGDTVYYGKTTGVSVGYEGKSCLIVTEPDIMWVNKE